MTTLALRAYRLEHGFYPETLTELPPTYLKAVPIDPFALSGPVRYRKNGNDYILYSVGPDGKDDGGKPIFDPTEPAPTSADYYDRRSFIKSDSTGDAVAGVNVT